MKNILNKIHILNPNNLEKSSKYHIIQLFHPNSKGPFYPYSYESRYFLIKEEHLEQVKNMTENEIKTIIEKETVLLNSDDPIEGKLIIDAIDRVLFFDNGKAAIVGGFREDEFTSADIVISVLRHHFRRNDNPFLYDLVDRYVEHILYDYDRLDKEEAQQKIKQLFLFHYIKGITKILEVTEINTKIYKKYLKNAPNHIFDIPGYIAIPYDKNCHHIGKGIGDFIYLIDYAHYDEDPFTKKYAPYLFVYQYSLATIDVYFVPWKIHTFIQALINTNNPDLLKNFKEDIQIAIKKIASIWKRRQINMKHANIEKLYYDGRENFYENIWINVDGNIGTIGVTDCIQKYIGRVIDVLFRNIYKEQKYNKVIKGEAIAKIKTAISIFDVYTPVTGEIIEFNKNLDFLKEPNLINTDPYGKGWIAKIKITDPNELKLLVHIAEDKDNYFLSRMDCDVKYIYP